MPSVILVQTFSGIETAAMHPSTTHMEKLRIPFSLQRTVELRGILPAAGSYMTTVDSAYLTASWLDTVVKLQFSSVLKVTVCQSAGKTVVLTASELHST